MDNTDTNIPSPEDRYKIILTGKILPGKNPDEVKQNLASIFKMTTTDIEQKISGKTVVVKSGIDLPTANKYMAALEKAGVECKSIPDKPSNATAPETDPSDNDTNPKKDQENITKDPSPAEPKASGRGTRQTQGHFASTETCYAPVHTLSMPGINRLGRRSGLQPL